MKKIKNLSKENDIKPMPLNRHARRSLAMGVAKIESTLKPIIKKNK